jgi:hypothetical protein
MIIFLWEIQKSDSACGAAAIHLNHVFWPLRVLLKENLGRRTAFPISDKRQLQVFPATDVCPRTH